MSLSKRLKGSLIVASACLRYLGDGDVSVRFNLSEAEDAPARLSLTERIPGAELDHGLACILHSWEAELKRADAAVCLSLGITERHVFLNEQTGQLVLHVFTSGRAESCRWMTGIGWMGW